MTAPKLSEAARKAAEELDGGTRWRRKDIEERIQAAIDEQANWNGHSAKEWSLALQGLTPGGSEFADDPERCVEYVRESRDSMLRQIKHAMRQRDEQAKPLAEALRESLEAQLETHAGDKNVRGCRQCQAIVGARKALEAYEGKP